MGGKDRVAVWINYHISYKIMHWAFSESILDEPEITDSQVYLYPYFQYRGKLRYSIIIMSDSKCMVSKKKGGECVYIDCQSKLRRVP